MLDVYTSIHETVLQGEQACRAVIEIKGYFPPWIALFGENSKGEEVTSAGIEKEAANLENEVNTLLKELGRPKTYSHKPEGHQDAAASARKR